MTVERKYIEEYITSHRVSQNEWDFSQLSDVISSNDTFRVAIIVESLVSDELLYVQRTRQKQVESARDYVTHTDEATMDTPCVYFSLDLERFLRKNTGGDLYSQETYLEIDKTLELVSPNFWNMTKEEQDRAIIYDAHTELERDVDYFRFRN